MTPATTQAATITDNALLNDGVLLDYITYIDRSERTTRAYIYNLRMFAAYMAYTKTTAPTRQTVLNYRSFLMGEHPAIMFDSVSGWRYQQDSNGRTIYRKCKAATVRAYLQSVKQFFTWTAQSGIYENIARNVHAPPVTAEHRKDALAPADIVTIEKHIADSRTRAIFQLACNAGLRTIEISRANVRDLEHCGGHAFISVWGKGRAEPDQRKPLALEVWQSIVDYLQQREAPATPESPLFTAEGNRHGGGRLSPSTISRIIKAALVSAGYDSDRLTAHSLRHTAAAAAMALTDNNIYLTQHYLRHASPKTTEIYLDQSKAATDEQLANNIYHYYHPDEQRVGAAELERLKEVFDRLPAEQQKQIAAELTERTATP